MIRLHIEGESNLEIAQQLNCSEQIVSNILNCAEAKKLISDAIAHNINTIVEVQDSIQLHAPVALGKLIEDVEKGVGRTRQNAAITLLEMAGHSAVKRVAFERADPRLSRLKELTPEQIREHLINVAAGKDDTGPDGNLLN